MKQLISLVLAGLSSSVFALSSQSVSYATQGEPLFVSAHTLEKSLDAKIVLQGVSGDTVVKGTYIGATGKEFLDNFSKGNQLTWVERDGNVILAPAGTLFSTKMDVKVANPTSFSRVVYDPKDKNKYGLMIFQVHNTWADNKSANGVQIVGVAQLFSQFVGIPVTKTGASNSDPRATPVKVEKEAPVTTNSYKQQLSFLGLLGKNQSEDQTGSASKEEIAINKRGVFPDTRLNAVLVRDKVELFESYKNIIALLDKPTDMVQVDAMIVDISRKDAIQYGVNWGYGKSSLGSGGLNLVLGQNAGAQLLSNIQASESAGNAELLSVPSVVSLNNAEAVFQSNQSRYIQVAGFQDASLNKISAQTALRVTPLIANESVDVPFNERRIKLLISIQDGSITGDASTTESNLTTQAVVRSGDTLVIGGQVIKNKTNGSNGVPVLSKVPVLGALFGAKTSSDEEYVRLYIMRPKILGEDSVTARQ